MGRYSVKRYKTKRYTRDLDQIFYDDLKNDTTLHQLKNQPFDETKPGMGQYYCVPCARYCESEVALKTHLKGKVHKRRLKDIKFGPYTKEEADMAAGKDVAKFLERQKLETKKRSEPHVQEQLSKTIVTEDTEEVMTEAMPLEESAVENTETVGFEAEIEA